MLPFYDRTVSVPRAKYLPSCNRGIPVPKDPTTLGGHLRKRRLQLKIFQAEAARKLRVSNRTLSLWECDRLYPGWSYWPRIVTYLNHDPFIDSTLGRPKGNETKGVAFLSSQPPTTIGQKIAKRRLELKKNRTQCAKELGISVKTLWGWENGQHKISRLFQERIKRFIVGGSPRCCSSSPSNSTVL